MRDETDLQLINLLQVDPRISWSEAGEILQMSPTIITNRQNRLVEKGPAQICTYSNPERRFTAMVEVDCRTEFLPFTAKQMCAHPLIMSIDETTERCDILLTIMVPNMVTLIALVIDWIGRIDGVYEIRSLLVTNAAIRAEPWRANIPIQRQINQALPQYASDRLQTGFDAVDLALAQAPAYDGRANVASLSQELNTPISTVHRRMRRLLTNQHLII